MGAFRMTVKADSQATGGMLALLEADEPAGFGPPMHTHEDAAEATKRVRESPGRMILTGASAGARGGS
jgi:hypothetical protein